MGYAEDFISHITIIVRIWHNFIKVHAWFTTKRMSFHHLLGYYCTTCKIENSCLPTDLFQNGSSNMKGIRHIDTLRQKQNSIILLTTFANQEMLYRQQTREQNNCSVENSSVPSIKLTTTTYQWYPSGVLHMFRVCHIRTKYSWRRKQSIRQIACKVRKRYWNRNVVLVGGWWQSNVRIKGKRDQFHCNNKKRS